MSQIEKNHMINAFAFELDHYSDHIVYKRMVQRITEIDLSLAQQVAEMVGADRPTKAVRTNHGKKAPGLSQFDHPPNKPTITSRRVAIIIADGYDPVAFNAVRTSVLASKAIPMIIAPKRSTITADGGKHSIFPHHHLEGFRSTMVDAVFVPGGKQSIATLSKNGRAIHWLREAFGHLKTIAATGEGVDLLQIAFQIPGIQMSSGGEAVESYGVVTQRNVKPESFTEAVEIAKGAKGFLESFFYSSAQHRNWARELDGLNAMVAY